MKTWNEEELKEVASQLSSPKGEEGVKTGTRMANSNENMINRAIDTLSLAESEYVLEIGPGNGNHVSGLLKRSSALRYIGIDVSETMVTEASRINNESIADGTVSFELSDGENLDFPEHTFDKIFTVNTLYFWKHPDQYAAEIYRVLKPGGSFSLAFAHKDFMEQLPFTKWDFQLYDTSMVQSLLEHAGFSILETVEEKDNTQSNLGAPVQRDIVIVRARKG